MRVGSTIELSEAEREKLLRLAQSNRVEVRLARRASIVLLAAEGWDNATRADILRVTQFKNRRLNLIRKLSLGTTQRSRAARF